MKPKREFLDPRKKLVEEVVDWLCGGGSHVSKIRSTPEGACSLAHVAVIVPTAQSARNLRFALAERAARDARGAILPPEITMANALLEPDGMCVATEAEELAAMADVLMECDISQYGSLFPKPPAERTLDWALDTGGMILSLYAPLGENALAMSDVKPQLDASRWLDLAALERLFVENLAAKGIAARSVGRRTAVANGCREEGIEEIVLPSCVDVNGAFVEYLGNSPQTVTVLIHADEKDSGKFDDWGRPVAFFSADIAPGMIESLPTAVVESDEIAKHFRAVREDESLPALVVCDSEMYPELEGAFQNYFSGEELVLRNPSKEKLTKSSLGRLLGAIVRLAAERDYETFSTFVRTGDAARWAENALGFSSAEVAESVGALDAVQNGYLPRTVDEVIRGASERAVSAWSGNERRAAAGLERLARAVRSELDDPFGFLKKIFSSLVLDEKRPADRELIAAARTVRDLREMCSSPSIPEKSRRGIFARLLKAASYMLEPVQENVLVTTGWLELPWCPDDEIVIAGFNEGCVPENIVGHPFLPDSLREELKLSANFSREARDSFIFAQAAACRRRGAVSVFLHQIAGDKNVMKPSRILFGGVSDENLPRLALRLYTLSKGIEGAPGKELPPAWRLKLPIPPKGINFRERISPTRLDQYVRCPFNFFLQEVFGERSNDRAQELDAMAFGNLCHEVLDRFAKEGPKDSTDPGEIASYLADQVRLRLKSFGEDLPAVVELQGEAAIERLKAFSVIQASRRKAGWRIACSERNLECRIKGCPTLLRGKVDRVDVHERTGEIAIIDYKTWSRAKEEYYSDSVQLPVYRAMLEASGLFDPAAVKSSKAFYCILAERAEDTLFDEGHAFHSGGQSEAEDLIALYLTDIAKGIFYPPRSVSGKQAWRDSYGSIIWQSPEEGVDPEWIEDQKSRREAE